MWIPAKVHRARKLQFTEVSATEISQVLKLADNPCCLHILARLLAVCSTSLPDGVFMTFPPAATVFLANSVTPQNFWPLGHRIKSTAYFLEEFCSVTISAKVFCGVLIAANGVYFTNRHFSRSVLF